MAQWVLGIEVVETLAVALGFLKARIGLQTVKVQLETVNEKTQAVIPFLRTSQYGAWGVVFLVHWGLSSGKFAGEASY